MKTITIAGNIGKDAETRTTPMGDSVTSWTVAVEDRRSKEKATIWFDVSYWGKPGISVQPYITKGGKITVSGDLGKREHDGKTYLTVRADNVTLQNSRQDSNDAPRASQPATRASDSIDFDEVPF